MFYNTKRNVIINRNQNYIFPAGVMSKNQFRYLYLGISVASYIFF